MFMRKDIAESYRKMQQADTPVIYSRLQGDETQSASNRSQAPGESSDAEGSDFELSTDVAPEDTLEADESDFETHPQFAPRDDEAPAASAPGSGSPSQQTSEAETDSGRDSEQAEPPADSQSTDDEGPQVPHSEATGGEALFQVALEEEAETHKRQSGRRRGSKTSSPDGVLVYCPHGHRIEVKERHRGRRGRCPRCRAPFYVPEKSGDQAQQDSDQESIEESATQPAGKFAIGEYRHWMEDVRVHVVNPQRLRLKPNSLLNAYEPYDFAFAPDRLLMIKLSKKASLLGSLDKNKPPAAREAVRNHLAEEKPVDDLPAAETHTLGAEALRDVKVIQPIRYEFESMFAGVPVFGEGRIAVTLPKIENSDHPRFASFSLSEFREFASILAELYGIEGLGAESDVPLTDSFTEQTCHYSEETLHVLEQAEFYEADPEIELSLIGWRCGACGLIVGEEARKKEKIGNLKGTNVGRVKCPKCKGKFGENRLYTLQQPATAGPPEGERAETEATSA